MHYFKVGQHIVKTFITYIVFVGLASFAIHPYQELPPFNKEIQEFKKQDSVMRPPKQAILFTGSSSFRLWKGLQDSFPGRTIINRAFGGSSLPHLILYVDDVIFRYDPKQIVIYCGDNDLASSDTITAATVSARFQKLFTMIRSRYPKVRIAYVSIKPSPSRIKLKPEMEEANTLIRDFLSKKKRTDFIDVYHPMLLADGRPNPSLFLSDSLHMNAKGYAIWKKTIEPYLIKR